MLGDFLGDIDLNQLDIQLGESTIHLSNLALNVDYLNQKKTNPVVAEIFSLMSRDEARHARFLNKGLSDFNLALDLGEKTFCKGGAKSTYPPEKQHKGVELLMKFFS
ncbi:hypothetical protein J5N97_005547 [Dioscorea zingiberensis]|uniref:magnesium-protoporphyrin IX monomethyl ester (oxidative) cyclase n=1 Tax=Dioscorea zingiberensis TaxID=325984 RepID=A0A9D5D8P6_9LILI|nr:hypothetical protein J5N97_005547 [Dioscorea zingiberensis]